MTRETKYRAWIRPSLNLKGCMIEVDEIWWSRNRVKSKNGTDYSLVECDLLKYTGLNDKNEKEIYKGDVIQMGNGKAEVIFATQGIQWESEGKYYVSFWALGYAQQDWDRTIYPLEGGGEIIGNIYENPELLKTAKGK